MKTLMKTMFASLVIGALALMPTQVFAQSAPEPAVVISIAKLEEQLADAKHLVEASGFGQMAFLINLQADQFLKGVDNSKDAGVLLYFDDEVPMPKALGFVPVSNMSDVLDTISNNLGEVDEGDEYTTVVADSGQEVHIKESGGYAYISDNPAVFSNIPSNPSQYLGDLPSNYNLAAKVWGQRIPEALRNQAIEMIREGYEAQIEAMGDEGGLAAGLQEGNMDYQMANIESMIQETESVVIGFVTDQEAGALNFDVEMVGLPNSSLAKRSNASADGKNTIFGGFVDLENNAFNFNACGAVLPEDAKAYKKMMTSLRDEGLKEIEADGEMSDSDFTRLEEAADEVIAVLTQTFDAGTVDSGAALRMNGVGDINFAGGLLLENPGKIEALVKKNISLLKDALGDALQVKLNSGSHEGLNLHTLVFTVPEEEEEAIEYFGEQVTVILGVGKNTLYAAAGSDPLPFLKEGIAKSKATEYKSANTSQWNIYLAPIMRFAAGVENNEMVEVMAEKLEEVGRDRIGGTVSMTKNGMKVRFSAEDGILSLIQAASQAMGGGFGPGEDDF